MEEASLQVTKGTRLTDIFIFSPGPLKSAKRDLFYLQPYAHRRQNRHSCLPVELASSQQ